MNDNFNPFPVRRKFDIDGNFLFFVSVYLPSLFYGFTINIFIRIISFLNTPIPMNDGVVDSFFYHIME